MMNKTLRMKRLISLALLGVLLVGSTLLAGCNQAPTSDTSGAKETTEPSPAVTVTPVKVGTQEADPASPAAVSVTPVAAAPESPATASKAAQAPVVAPAPVKASTPQSPTQPAAAATNQPPTAVQQIEATRNLIRLHELVARLKSAGELSPEVSAAADAKHKALLDAASVVQFTEKLDLLATEMRMLGPDKARIFLLFRPNAKLTSDYKIALSAIVDKADAEHLSADADKKNLAERVEFWPPSTKEWNPGEEVLVTTDANLKPIRYRLTLGLYANEPAHRLGERMVIANVSGAGYQEGVETEEAKLDGIAACKDLIQLYEKAEHLKSAGPMSPAVSAALEEKHKALLEKANVVHYTDKLDVLAADLRDAGSGKKKIYILFRPNVQLTSDYKIALFAVVDKSHAKHLSADADKKSLAEKVIFWPPSTKKWTPGKEVLVTTEAKLKDIPYKLSMGLYANVPSHRLGDVNILGWYAAGRDE